MIIFHVHGMASMCGRGGGDGGSKGDDDEAQLELC